MLEISYFIIFGQISDRRDKEKKAYSKMFQK